MIFYCFFQLIIKRKFFDPKFNGGKTEIESFRSLLFYDILYINTENFFLKPLEIKEKMYGINIRISDDIHGIYSPFSDENSFRLRISVKRQILHAFLHRRVKVTTRCASLFLRRLCRSRL